MTTPRSISSRFAGRARSYRDRAFARFQDSEGAAISNRVRRERLTFLSLPALMGLRQRVLDVDRDGVPGVLIELGTALGGSAIVMAASKASDRPLEVYDVFGMIPPPSERDGADVHTRYEVIKSGKAKGFEGETYYGYQTDLEEKVADTFVAFGYPLKPNRISLHKGLFEDTLDPVEPVALAHIDGDWYESVKVCVDRIWPHLSPGGAMIIDDYFGWSGCRTAVDEFLSATPDAKTEKRANKLHITKPR